MHKRMDLGGAWQFHEAGATQWKAGHVPGCVQLDLIRLGELPDPFYRLNEVEAIKLEPKDWVYRRTFEVAATELQGAYAELVFEGLDTLADVYLNDELVGHVDNMFVAQRYEVTTQVRPGTNELEVRFSSPVNAIRDAQAKSPLRLASSPESARPYLRKAQYAYGWDWGPRLVQVGIWRPVYLELGSGPRLAHPYFRTEHLDARSARVRVSADVRLAGPSVPSSGLSVQVTVSIDGSAIARAAASVENTRGIWGTSVSLQVESPRLWWPNGMGPQPLYDVTIRLLGSEGQALDELGLRTGIRTVQVRQEDDVEGRSFVFEINGTAIFAKGANWVPADSLLPRLTRQDYARYVQLARDANMNMLRVWGGGIYEDPAFYEACDEMGIMVWQDFMYACAQYPDELDWFQRQARHEAESVVTALRNHPSIVLWCGNNENNWGFDEWWPKTWAPSQQPKFLGNYVYREILPQVCSQLDPSRPYWVSSPYGGDTANSMEEGDRHSWGVWSGWQDYCGYLKDTGRFISEFGFQSMPSWRTVLAYTAPEDRSIFSPVMLSHNKMVEGMERLTRFMVGRLGFPHDLRSFVYLTQFNQAEAIKVGVEHWRLRKFMTSGTLYWQLNDCWPVASWSCLDYYKRKKGLYYYSQRFYNTLYPVLRLEGDEIALYGISDLPVETRAKARVSAYTLAGAKLSERTLEVLLHANRVTPLDRVSIARLGIGQGARVLPMDGASTTNPVERNGALLDSVVYVDLIIGAQIVPNYLVFGRFRDLQLQRPTIAVTVDGQRITLLSDKPAFGVFIETEADVDLSDNCLNLEPSRPVTVHCSGAPGEVRALSLADMVAYL